MPRRRGILLGCSERRIKAKVVGDEFLTRLCRLLQVAGLSPTTKSLTLVLIGSRVSPLIILLMTVLYKILTGGNGYKYTYLM